MTSTNSTAACPDSCLTQWERALAIAGCTGHNIVRLRPKNMTPVLEAAMGYAIFRDWQVFPANLEDGEKKSYLSAEHAPGHQPWGMTADPEQIQRNFINAKWRLKCGVGVPTGAVNGVIVIEADTIRGHGVDGLTSLQELEAKHGKLPDTLAAESPSGSVHRYYRHPGRGIRIKGSTSELAPGVDVRGDGNMVIAPPSVRADGEYRWINNLPIAEAPQWLIDLISEPPEETDAAPHTSSTPTGEMPVGDDKQAHPSLVAAALAVIPNSDTPDTHAFWDRIGIPPNARASRAYWVKVGFATKGAAGEAGEEAFDTWSKKWPGYNKEKTAEFWAGAHPTRIGAGTLFELANMACPGWREAYNERVRTEWAAAAKQRQERREEQEAQEEHEEPKKDPPKARLMQTSAEFVANFVPPDYLVDGLMQRQNVYSFTSPTGGGKTTIALLIAAHVAHGMPLAGKEVEKGRVLYFAGENPDDVRSRWILLCEDLGKNPDTMDVVFMPFTPNLSETQIRARIDAEAGEHGPFSLLIVDTSAAYYTGSDENDNVALGNHARLLRTFKDLPGGPTILVTCHPVKNPDMTNLLPRGGGAFLAEVDGNLVCIKDPATMLVEVTWHGKFRGPDFAPFAFRLVAGQSEKLKDSKGRKIWSICARPVSNEEQEAIEKVEHTEQDRLLRAMLDQPGRSLTDLAKHLLWRTMVDGRPNKTKVYRVMKDLQKLKLVELQRDGHYVLTKKGEDEAAKTPEDLVKVVPE